MSRILVVEDEAHLAEGLAFNLEAEGHHVEIAGDGRSAVARLADGGSPFDLVVLDLMLPEMSGFEVARRTRASGNYVPILILTAKDDSSDVVRGIEEGADDYVVKPFSPQELVSRVRAVLRRVRGSGTTSDERPLVYGSLRIDPKTRLVEVDGRERSLTVKEFDLLWALARHPRQVLPRDQLLDMAWGLTEYIDPSTVTVHVTGCGKESRPIQEIRATF